MSKWPEANLGSSFQLQMSVQMVGSALGSMSSKVTSHPSSAKTRRASPREELQEAAHRFHCRFIYVGLAGQPEDRDQGGTAAVGEVQSNAKGGKYLSIKGKDGCNNPTFHSTQWAAVAWEPSTYAAEGDSRVNVCLEATEELAEAVLRWETAAAGLAIKHAASVFGKALSQAWMQERLQSCLKASAQGLRFCKLKATTHNVRFWDSEGKRAEAPASLRGRKVLAAVQPWQLWVMNQQRGLVLELRDVKEQAEDVCPL